MNRQPYPTDLSDEQWQLLALILPPPSLVGRKRGVDLKGYDAGKKVSGRKRHILVDAIGLLIVVKVLAASTQDRDGAKLLLGEVKERMPRLFLI